MVQVIFLIVALLILLSLYGTFRTAETPNGPLLLGVTLPLDRLMDGEVRAIADRYHRKNLLAAGLSLAGLLPLFPLWSFDSLSLGYLAIWTTAVIFAFQRVFTVHSRELSGLKNKSGWLVGERHMVTVDTEVSRLRDTLPPKKLWFLPALAVNLLPLWVRATQGARGQDLLAAALQGLVPLLALFGLFCWFAGARTVAYSGNTEGNLAVNLCAKRSWGGCFLGLSYLHGLCFCLAASFPQQRVLAVAALAAESLGALAAMGWAFRRVRREKNRLLALEREPILLDEDQYWQEGNYYNPQDPRVFVEKRLGYGMTVNMARGLGKILNLLPLAALLFVAVLAVFLGQFDFGEVQVQGEGDRIQITAPLYSYEFSREEIQKVELLQELPALSKRSGYDGARLYLGAFRVEGYGESEVFLHRSCPPYLAVTLPDATVFVNRRTPEETRAVMALLG